MDWTLIVAVLALIVSIPSAWSARKALRWQRDSADAAMRAAEAAEYANLLTERALARPGSGELGEVRAPQPATNDVSWRIDRGSGSRYVLRNTGTAIAEHVSVDAEQLGALARRLPVDAVIRPGQGADILILSTWGRPAPNELHVKWGDMQDYEPVPMPPG